MSVITHRLADFLRELKIASSKWVDETIGIKDFAWQKGYGGFTVSISQIELINNYITQQKEHHQKRSFEQEYIVLLQKNKVEYDERYVW